MASIIKLTYYFYLSIFCIGFYADFSKNFKPILRIVSQIFIIGSQAVLVLPGDLNVVGNTILVNWSNGSDVGIQVAYDVFAAFDGGDLSYVGTSNTSSYSFLKTGTSSVRVVVQISSINPAINSSIKIYDSGVRSLV
jgi:hypothetical protein